jgi:AcrR family transcriptional regulator
MARPRSDIQPRLVHAARGRFLADGVDGASLRDIAKDARTNIGMVSYYFATKDDLFLAVVEEVYAKLLEDLAAALHTAAPLRQRLERVSARIGHLSDHELDVVRLVAREALSSNERFGRLLARFQVGHVALLVAAVAEGVATGEIDDRAPLPATLLITVAALAVPQFMRRAIGERMPLLGAPNADELAATLMDLLFRGIAPAKRTGRS